jgi:phosphatidylglycerophosphatase A
LTHSPPDDNICELFKSLMQNKTTILIASGLGTGYSPVAPGTAGSALGVGLAALYAWAGGFVRFEGLIFPALILILFVVGVWASGRAEVIYGQKDCGKIVIDEVVGMLITLYLLPATWLYLTLGFFMFRLFDIVKPFPARRIDQRLGGGLGVMLDDVVAGIYANLCLQALGAVLK